MKKIYVLDRIEDGVATIVCDDGEAINLSPDVLVGLSIGDVFSAQLQDGVIYDIVPDYEETRRRGDVARSYLEKFKNKKHNREKGKLYDGNKS